MSTNVTVPERRPIADGAPSDGPLLDAARDALLAPSIFNTQPWRWRVVGDRLELRADPARRLPGVDPDGLMLALSCGAALHHARVSVSAAGFTPLVERLPDPADPDLLAVVRCGVDRPPAPSAVRLRDAMTRRHTDRRPYADAPVPPATLDALRAVVTDAGAYAHPVRSDQLQALTVAATEAAATQTADPAYRADLARWTSRPAAAGDGVPPAAAGPDIPRLVPTRNHAATDRPARATAAEAAVTAEATAQATGATGSVDDGPADRGATYLLVFGATDGPVARLRGGEALSALLLTATVAGLSAAPMSDLVEVPWARRVLRHLLAGLGEPFVVVRVGYPAAEPSGDRPEWTPATPRRPADEVIDRGAEPGGGAGHVST
jgi:nitroreductase